MLCRETPRRTAARVQPRTRSAWPARWSTCRPRGVHRWMPRAVCRRGMSWAGPHVMQGTNDRVHVRSRSQGVDAREPPSLAGILHERERVVIRDRHAWKPRVDIYGASPFAGDESLRVRQAGAGEDAHDGVQPHAFIASARRSRSERLTHTSTSPSARGRAAPARVARDPLMNTKSICRAAQTLAINAYTSS